MVRGRVDERQRNRCRRAPNAPEKRRNVRPALVRRRGHTSGMPDNYGHPFARARRLTISIPTLGISTTTAGRTLTIAIPIANAPTNGPDRRPIISTPHRPPIKIKNSAGKPNHSFHTPL